MTLPAPVNSHHTAWIRGEGHGCRPRALRYAVDGTRLVCFGDRQLADLGNGTRVHVAVHEIAGGPALAEFGTTLRDTPADDVDAGAIAVLLDHVALGRDAAEVEQSMTRHRARRLVVLEP